MQKDALKALIFLGFIAPKGLRFNGYGNAEKNTLYARTQNFEQIHIYTFWKGAHNEYPIVRDYAIRKI